MAGLFDLGLAIYLYLVWRMMGVAVAGTIALITENLLFMEAFAAKLLNCPSLILLQPTLIVAITVLRVLSDLIARAFHSNIILGNANCCIPLD